MVLRLGTLKIEFGARPPPAGVIPTKTPSTSASGTSMVICPWSFVNGHLSMVIFTHTTFPLPTHAAHAHAFDPHSAHCARTHMVKAQRTETEGVGGCELLGRRPDAEMAPTHPP